MYAYQAVGAKDAPAEVRAVALMVLHDWENHERKFESAIGRLEELVRMRRYHDDWRLLGVTYLALNQPEKALPALQKALAIRPYRHATHTGLAQAYRQLGDAQRAREHSKMARWLFHNRQD